MQMRTEYSKWMEHEFLFFKIFNLFCKNEKGIVSTEDEFSEFVRILESFLVNKPVDLN